MDPTNIALESNFGMKIPPSSSQIPLGIVPEGALNAKVPELALSGPWIKEWSAPHSIFLSSFGVGYCIL
ncbi:hypothetical protein OIDMADRAFT_18483, partial [Oidiodendron maius Zn]